VIIIKKVRLVLTDECNFKCPCCYNEGNVTKNKKVILDADNERECYVLDANKRCFNINTEKDFNNIKNI